MRIRAARERAVSRQKSIQNIFASSCRKCRAVSCQKPMYTFIHTGFQLSCSIRNSRAVSRQHTHTHTQTHTHRHTIHTHTCQKPIYTFIHTSFQLSCSIRNSRAVSRQYTHTYTLYIHTHTPHTHTHTHTILNTHTHTHTHTHAPACSLSRSISLRLASPPGIAGIGGSEFGEFSEDNTLTVVTESLARCEIVSRMGSPQIWHAATTWSLAAPHAPHKRPGPAPQPRRTPFPPRACIGRNPRENAEGVFRGLVAAMKSAHARMGGVEKSLLSPASERER